MAQYLANALRMMNEDLFPAAMLALSKALVAYMMAYDRIHSGKHRKIIAALGQLAAIEDEKNADIVRNCILVAKTFTREALGETEAPAATALLQRALAALIRKPFLPATASVNSFVKQ